MAFSFINKLVKDQNSIRATNSFSIMFYFILTILKSKAMVFGRNALEKSVLSVPRLPLAQVTR